MRKTSAGWYMLFVFPLFFIFSTVVLAPFFMGIIYSFVSWDGLPLNPKTFTGFDNYLKMLSDARFVSSSLRTAYFTLISIVAINVLALAFALVATTSLKARNVARTMLFMPYLIGGLILGYIWKFILGDAFKALGEATGLSSIFFNWLIDPNFAVFALVVVTTWQMAGYVMIIYITGIQGIPEEVIEAAEVDGAGFWTKLIRIKFPLIMQSFTICLFLSISSCFKIFDVNLSLTGGGPYNSTEMFAMNIYNEIFSLNNYGYGQSKAIAFFLAAACLTLAQVVITKKKEVEIQ
ncbi:MAG: sugar ABC transporter permease [Clostridiales bacterium]|jgi:raffinose/stachyose/melibiose transport system permease protein|nr:sugar ABC transporter permease [Clostridiales bacterium]